MNDSKKVVRIQSIYFRVAIVSSLFSLLFFCFNAFLSSPPSFSISFAGIVLIVCAITWIAPSVRNIEIDERKKVIVVRDGFASTAELPFGSITKIEEIDGWHAVTYKHHEKLKTFNFALNFYSLGSRKRILSYILEFNPQAKVSV